VTSRVRRSAVTISTGEKRWRVHFFKRGTGANAVVPARKFLDESPAKVSAMMLAVLEAVAEAPPPAFSGGGKWEAMHGDMAGFYEVRVDGPGRVHYRLFCVLAREGAPSRSGWSEHRRDLREEKSIHDAVSEERVRGSTHDGAGAPSESALEGCVNGLRSAL
jgi:hypothetical protein